MCNISAVGSHAYNLISILSIGQALNSIHLNKIRINCPRASESSLNIWTEFTLTHPNFVSTLKNSEFWEYTLNTNYNEAIRVYTREKSRIGSVSASSLCSHKSVGVDYTGMVCVWPAEQLLLFYLLNYYREHLFRRNVLELGGGMTGLCGLGLAAAGVCASITTTDGHPDCVANQVTCIRMCQQKNVLRSRISAGILRWTSDDQDGQLRALCCGTGGFDVVIAADCLFFRDCHGDLLGTLRSALRPGGAAFLLQPRRGPTMDMFLALAEEWFLVERLDCCSEVQALHLTYLKSHADCYDPDIHLHLLVRLTLKAPGAC